MPFGLDLAHDERIAGDAGGVRRRLDQGHGRGRARAVGVHVAPQRARVRGAQAELYSN